MKKAVQTMLLLLGGLFLSVLLAESILRLFFPQTLYSFDKGLFKSSAKYGYCLTPGARGNHATPEYSYTIEGNSFGFRGKEPNRDAEERILILGDSFGMGQGVDQGETLCEVAERDLQNMGLDVDVFNTSLSGYSGINQVAVLSENIGHYAPDLVVLLFCWNDIGMTKSLQVQNGYLVLNVENAFVASLREWLNNHSQLYCLVKKAYYASKNEVKRGNVSGFVQHDLHVAVRRIEQMHDICLKNDLPFVVSMIPLHGIYEGSDLFQESKATFMHLLEERAITVHDWTLELPEIDRESLVFKVDHHWTRQGHRYFGAILSRLIARALDASPLTGDFESMFSGQAP